MQPVVQPVIGCTVTVLQPVECLYTRYNQLFNWLNNRLHGVN